MIKENDMELPGTGYLVQVEIESHRGQSMKDFDFSLDFYVHANRRIKFTKNQLVRIERDGGTEYYAMLDSRRLGTGRLMCNVSISDPESRWAGGRRPVLLRRDTGKVIGSDMCSASNAVQGQWAEGYRVHFNFVWSIPKPEVAYIFYGKFIDQITSFDELTPDMLLSPENTIVSVSAGKMGKTPVSGIVPGDKVLVLIPEDYGYVATKDNGLGGKVPFDTSIMGCNGEKRIAVDDTVYKIYGEFMTVGGELFIYVD